MQYATAGAATGNPYVAAAGFVVDLFGSKKDKPPKPQAPADWDEGAYLRANPDITPTSWENKTGYEHFLMFGQSEGRAYALKPMQANVAQQHAFPSAPGTAFVPSGELNVFGGAGVNVSQYVPYVVGFLIIVFAVLLLKRS